MLSEEKRIGRENASPRVLENAVAACSTGQGSHGIRSVTNKSSIFEKTQHHLPMIRCLPRSLCSWDFTVIGLSSGTAIVEYDWLTEQGRIVVAHHDYRIRKQGVLSGRWTFEQPGRVIADAHKPSALSRTFHVSGGTAGPNLTLRAESAFFRAFEIISERRVVGRISPVHPFTRRSTIHCSSEIPEHLQLFAFWMAGLAWRRSARRD
jgi:hypothetical protein